MTPKNKSDIEPGTEEHTNKGRLEPGTSLFGYRVLDFVGEGGWAYVYKARHPVLPMFVAIKQLKPELVQDEDALQRFLREANIVARLNHPNVVTIYDLKHDEEADQHYIFTEFAEKGDLADRLTESPEGLPVNEVLHLGMGICSGLEAVHRRGVVHRDIRPGNILLFDVGEERDIPKLSDFGIAKAPAIAGVEIPESPGVSGYIYYTSPEQLDENIEVDYRSDLYSLGILLYKLLTGQVPFTGEVGEVFWAHMGVSPKPPREIRPDIPEALEQIVLRALRKDREERYQSAAEMYEAIKAIVDISIIKERQRKFESFVEQGLAHLKKGDWEPALDALGQANVLEPENERVLEGLQKAREQQRLERLYDLGGLYLKEEKWEEAREYLASVISIDVGYADGQAMEQLKRVTQELEQERTQRDLLAQYRKGMGYFHGRQWPEAITELGQVVARDPGFEDAAARLAEAQRYERAERLYEQAQRHAEREEWEEATDLLAEVESLNPPHIDVTEELNHARKKWEGTRKAKQLAELYDVGMAQLAEGDLRGAKSCFEKIEQRRPGYKDVAERLKEVEKRLKIERLLKKMSDHEAAGEWEQAISVCTEILTIDPLNRQASRCLERVQKCAGGGDGKGPRKIVTATQDWWDDQDRRTKTALMALFGLIVLTLCVVAARIIGPSVSSFFSTATPTPTLISTLTSITPTSTGTPTPTSTPTPTKSAPTPLMSTPTDTPTSTPTATPTPTNTPTSTPTYRPASTPTPAVVLAGPEDGATFLSGARITFYWTGPAPEPGYYEVRLDGESLGRAEFDSTSQQWKQVWEAKQKDIGNHTWQVVWMAPDEHTPWGSSQERSLYVETPGPSPVPTHYTP